MQPSASASRGLSTARRRWALALAFVVSVLLFNSVRLSEFRASWTSSAAITSLSSPASRSTDCASMDAFHRDPLFTAHATCLTQPQVVAVLRDLVLTIAGLFETYNITYFLDSGTLLGVFRNNSVIAYDTDADMGITEAGFDYIRSHRIAIREPYFLSVYASSDMYPGSLRDKGIPIRVIHKSSALYVDVFVFLPAETFDDTESSSEQDMIGPHPSWAFDKCVHCSEYYNEGKRLLVPRDWIFPTRRCSFEGHELQCPRETEKYLRYLFGDDFETPIQY